MWDFLADFITDILLYWIFSSPDESRGQSGSNPPQYVQSGREQYEEQEKSSRIRETNSAYLDDDELW
jgi:hypothetical protein